MMEGGPSHIDTFDPKPKLDEAAPQGVRARGQAEVRDGKRQALLRAEPVQVPQGAARAARTWRRTGSTSRRVADDICFFRGCQVDSVNHPTAMYQMNCGNRFGGDPGIGAWVNYGLGSRESGSARLHRAARGQLSAGRRGELEQRLPARAVSRARRCARKARPFSISRRPRESRRSTSAQNLDLLAKLNAAHAAQHPGHDELAARMDNYELAFRMQMQVPEVLDLSQGRREDEGTLRHRPGRRPMPSAASACSRASSSRRACASCSSTTAPGTATTTSSAPTAISSAAWTSRSPRSSPT